MTTITINEDIDIGKNSFETLSDFLSSLDPEIVYEEYLESKLQSVQKAKINDFMNL